MKTPDEIKNGLGCCTCPTSDCDQCPYHKVGDGDCFDEVKRDDLAYIRQLEAERDAAVEALKDFGGCMACKSANVLKRDSPCKECILDGQVTRDYWIWRGVQKEDSDD